MGNTLNAKHLRLLFLAIISCLSCSGCAVKYGNYNISDTGTKQFLDNNRYLGLEARTPAFWKDKVDMNFGFGIKTGPSSGQLQTTVGPISAVNTDLVDVYSTMRYFPFGVDSKKYFFEPYVGAGIGYFKLKSERNTPGAPVTGSACPYGFDCYEINKNNTTLADGINPHAVLGSYIPIGNSFSFIIEDRVDAGKTSNGFDFSGNIIWLGLGWH